MTMQQDYDRFYQQCSLQMITESRHEFYVTMADKLAVPCALVAAALIIGLVIYLCVRKSWMHDVEKERVRWAGEEAVAKARAVPMIDCYCDECEESIGKVLGDFDDGVMALCASCYEDLKQPATE